MLVHPPKDQTTRRSDPTLGRDQCERGHDNGMRYLELSNQGSGLRIDYVYKSSSTSESNCRGRENFLQIIYLATIIFMIALPSQLDPTHFRHPN